MKIGAIWVLPTVEHAFDKDLLPYEQRVPLVESMIRDVSAATTRSRGWSNHDIQVVRRPEKHMVDSLAVLHHDNPDTDFILVLGADILGELDSWHQWEDVCNLATPLFVSRVGCTPENTRGYEVHAIDAPDVSSTSIRARLAKGDLTYLIGPGADIGERVLSDIEQQGLYGYTRLVFPDALESVQVRHVELSNLQTIPPGQVFHLVACIKQVLSVEWTDNCDGKGVDGFELHVLINTGMVESNQSQVRDWLREQTKARQLGKPFKDPKPVPRSPGLQYLKVGDEPGATDVEGTFLGMAGGYAFWQCTVEIRPFLSALWKGLL